MGLSSRCYSERTLLTRLHPDIYIHFKFLSKISLRIPCGIPGTMTVLAFIGMTASISIGVSTP